MCEWYGGSLLLLDIYFRRAEEVRLRSVCANTRDRIAGMYTILSPWQYHDTTMTIPWQYHDTTMTIPWHYHDNTMTLPWHYHDNAMTIPWQCHDTTMTLPWQYHDNTMTLPWQYHDTTMTIPWQYHDNTMICLTVEYIGGCTTSKWIHWYVYHVHLGCLKAHHFLVNTLSLTTRTLDHLTTWPLDHWSRHRTLDYGLTQCQRIMSVSQRTCDIVVTLILPMKS